MRLVFQINLVTKLYANTQELCEIAEGAQVGQKLKFELVGQVSRDFHCSSLFEHICGFLGMMSGLRPDE